MQLVASWPIQHREQAGDNIGADGQLLPVLAVKVTVLRGRHPDKDIVSCSGCAGQSDHWDDFVIA